MRMIAACILHVFTLLMLVNFSMSLKDPWTELWSSSVDSKKDLVSVGGNEVVLASDLRGPDRRIWIITTACLPWLTGTSVNPLLRAAYLAKDRPDGMITLMVPWLPESDQDIAFPPGVRFTSPDEQRIYVQKWLIDEAQLPLAAKRLRIMFYNARYHDEFHSIFPMGDISSLIPDSEADVCVLEEPEHLNWYRAPFTSKAWVDKFRHVVGIIHTNYLIYTRGYSGGLFKEPLLFYLNQGMCRANCHKIIKLSGALQEFASEKEEISNVHGVREKYLNIGDRSSVVGFSKGAYFVGKLAWAKGLDRLFQHMDFVKKRTGKCFNVDIFGQGPHTGAIKDFARDHQLPTTFHGAVDHSLLTEYRVFVNPSLSEVLCTTIVEALAMGKWVVCAKHPSNDFFEQFPNCLTYRSEEEFAANVYWALTHDPTPLSSELRHTLSWEAATERFLTASMITTEMLSKANTFADQFCKWASETVFSSAHGDYFRALAGAKSVSKQIEYMKEFGSAAPVLGDINTVMHLQGDTNIGTTATAQVDVNVGIDVAVQAPTSSLQHTKIEATMQDPGSVDSNNSPQLDL